MHDELPVPVFDADNHMYETTDAFVKYLPAEYDGLVKFVQVEGRTKIALRNVISEYIPNPTFNKVGPPGGQEMEFRRKNPSSKHSVGGGYGVATSGDEIDHNILSNPGSGKNIQIFWSGGVAGSGNSVHDNVYWGGGFDTGAGVSYANNTQADPKYTNRAGKDFTLSAGSPAAGYGVASTAPSDSPPPAAPEGSSSIPAGVR